MTDAIYQGSIYKNLRRAAVLVGLSLLPVSAAYAADPSTLVVDIATAPSTLDPAWGCGLWDIGFIQNFYVRLTQYGHKPGPNGTEQFDPGHIVPYLAKSWTVSDDGTIYTFTLNDGYKFASGKPVDAAAVKYSFERTLKINGCGGYFLLDGFMSPPLIKSIEAPNPKTVVITLSHPDPNALENWAQPSGSIVDKDVVDANGGIVAGKPNEYLSSHAAGSGPFLLTAYSPNQSAVLEANPNFGGPPPGAKRIEINWINSAPTLLLQARTGKADVTLGLSKQAVASLKGDGKVKIVANSVPSSQLVLIPNGKAPWNNIKVRQAVTYAVPYEDILKKVAFGYGKLYFGPIPPTLPGYNAELSKPRNYDLAKAKALIKESGIATPAPVELVIEEGDAVQQQIATVLQSSWKQIGLEVKIRVASSAEFQDLAEGHKAQALLRLDGPGVMNPGYFLGYDMLCGISFNLTEACIPEADKLLAEARVTIDPVKRQGMYDDITKLWRDNAPKITLFEDEMTTVLSKDVKSYYFAYELDMKTWSK